MGQASRLGGGPGRRRKHGRELRLRRRGDRPRRRQEPEPVPGRVPSALSGAQGALGGRRLNSLSGTLIVSLLGKGKGTAVNPRQIAPLNGRSISMSLKSTVSAGTA